MKGQRILMLLGILFIILSFSSCAFIDGMMDGLFDEKGFGGDIQTSMNITVTPYDGANYPGPSDRVTVRANTFPTIFWEVAGVAQISEFWVFVYSPVLYEDGLTAAVLPDVWVIEDIAPNYRDLVFGDVPPGAYQWDDPLFQTLIYNGTYIFWVASFDTSGVPTGFGMAEVTVIGGIEPPDPPDLRVDITDASVVDIGGGQYEVTINFKIYNDGEIEAKDFEIAVWGNNGYPPVAGDSGYSTSRYYSGGLKPLELAYDSIVITTNQNSGTAYIVIDHWDYVSESNEFNNTSNGWSWLY